APVLVKRGDDWKPLAPVTVRALTAHGDTVWAIAGPNQSLVRLSEGESEPVLSWQKLYDIAAGDGGLWAVGENGRILRLERRWLPAFTDKTFEAGVGVQAASATAVLCDLDGAVGPDLLLAVPFGRNSVLRAESPGAFRSQPLATPPLAEMPDATSL